MNLGFRFRFLLIAIGMATGALVSALIGWLWWPDEWHFGIAAGVGAFFGAQMGHYIYDEDDKGSSRGKIALLVLMVFVAPAVLAAFAAFVVLPVSLPFISVDAMGFLGISEETAWEITLWILGMGFITYYVREGGIRSYWPVIPVSIVVFYYARETWFISLTWYISLAAIAVAAYLCTLVRNWFREADVHAHISSDVLVPRGNYVLQCGAFSLFRVLRMLFQIAFVIGGVVIVVSGIFNLIFFVFPEGAEFVFLEGGMNALIRLITTMGAIGVGIWLSFLALSRIILPGIEKIESYFPWLQGKWRVNFPDSAIYAALKVLRCQHPVFHLESDFRYLYAKALSEALNKLAKALSEKFLAVHEEAPTRIGEKERIDIVIGDEIAIELKYLPVKLSVVWKGEEYNRNDFDSRKNPASVESDISRLQELVDDQSSKIQRGFVIIVTNSNLLLKEPHGWQEWHKFSERKSEQFYYAVIPVVHSGD